MSTEMKSENRRWTAKRKSALVLDVFKGKTTVSEASRAYDLSPSEIEGWIEEAIGGMENALRAKPHDIREQYERKVKDGCLMLQKKALALLDSLEDKKS